MRRSRDCFLRRNFPDRFNLLILLTRFTHRLQHLSAKFSVMGPTAVLGAIILRSGQVAREAQGFHLRCEIGRRMYSTVYGLSDRPPSLKNEVPLVPAAMSPDYLKLPNTFGSLS
jgi:hypothetical protein